MTGPSPAVAATRVAVRAALVRRGESARDALAGADRAAGSPRRALVACSGGPDSLALAAATAFEAPRLGWSAGAIVVDHNLQPGSADVAERAARVCADVGLHPALTTRADLAILDGQAGGGPEALARAARYAAFTEAAEQHGAGTVLLGHTRDDQAEQVLLGLARGSGARSLAGMPRERGVFVRPLIDLPASLTRRACADLGLTPWLDPHNDDDRYLRVRARRLLHAAEAELGPGVAAALARSATLLRADADALDALARETATGLGPGPWPVESLATLVGAVRGRVWRLLLHACGVPAGDLAYRHVAQVDRLVTDWSGQGPVYLPGGYTARRSAGAVRVDSPGADADCGSG